MGRGKIEIKRIENQTNRQVTFAKRKNGLLKKAKEISVLCDVKVSVIIFGPNSKIYSNEPNPEMLSSILEEYHKNVGHRLWDAKHEDLNSEIERIKKENENMSIKLRHLKAEDAQTLSCGELIAADDLLENGLTRIREKKTEFVNRLMERRDFEEVENARLQYKLAKMEIEGKMGDGVSNAQMPFFFRVQPLQPNLHNRM